MYEGDPSGDLSPLLAVSDSSDGDTQSQESDLSEPGIICQSIPAKDTYPAPQTGQECEDPSARDISEVNAESSPLPRKKYSHYKKRRRSITDELFRCTFVTKVISDELTCGALLWKGKPQELRAHLLTHLPLATVSAMSDQQIVDTYTQAKSSLLEPMPDDKVHGITQDDLDEDAPDDVEGDTPDE